MSKMIFLLLLLWVTGTASTNAQVTIGKDSIPHGGALLDLQQPNSNTKKGLKLPVVSLSDAEEYGLTSGVSATATGMIVYNNNASIAKGSGIGIYVWDGTKWNILGGSGSTGEDPCASKNLTIQWANPSVAVCPGTELESSMVKNRISLQATGGKAPYTYDSDSFDADGVINPGIIMPDEDMEFTVTVTDADGCSLSDYLITLPVQTFGCLTLEIVPVVEVGILSFITRNIGADVNLILNPLSYNAGTDSSPTGSLNGDYYQWGRVTDGHEKWNSETVAGPVSMLDANNQATGANIGKFITVDSGNWRSVLGNSSWTDGSRSGGPDNTANPCPLGFRIPTKSEWEFVNGNVTAANRSALTLSKQGINVGSTNLFLPAAGKREHSDGSFAGVGTSGYYWSCTTTSNNAYFFAFSNSGSSVGDSSRALGFSVRCVKSLFSAIEQ